MEHVFDCLIAVGEGRDDGGRAYTGPVSATILVLGGYGTTGRMLSELLLEYGDAHLVLAGRDLGKARRAAGELAARYAGRVEGRRADAADAWLAKQDRLPDLLDELKMARTKGMEAFDRLRKQFIKYDLLIIDEWLLFPISMEDTQILLSLVDRRHNHQATIIASQFEPAEWLDRIPLGIAAEAITDRLRAQAYRMVIKGVRT